MAKLQPYDGKTVYSKEGNKEFLGYELLPYQRRVEIKKIDKGLEVTFEVGTQIAKQTRITTSYIETSVHPIPSPRREVFDPVPREGPIPNSFFYYIDGEYCDEKIYHQRLRERQEDKELREERLDRTDPYRNRRNVY